MFGLVGVPCAAAGNATPPLPAPVTVSTPPESELYAALPQKVAAKVPPEMTSFHVVAPDVAKLDGLLASNSMRGVTDTAAYELLEYPASPASSTRVLIT